jgi:integrase
MRNDVSIEGFKFNKTSGRFKSFLATYPNEHGKIVRKRISFERVIKDIHEAREEKARLLSRLDAHTRVSFERLKYIEKLQRYKDLVDEFHKQRLNEASKSTADNNKSYLLNWGLKFFIDVKSEYNFKNWPLLFDEFKAWLSYQKSDRDNTKAKTSELAVNSQNNAIRALNAFIAFMEAKTGERILRCTVKDSPLIKGPECVLSDAELEQLLSHLEKAEEHAVAEFLLVLRHTGLRVMEGLGLNFMSCNFKSLLPSKDFINKRLRGAGIQMYGRIDLLYQLDGDTTNQRLKFGPLKHRPAIDVRYARYIPIMDKKLGEILRRRTRIAFAKAQALKAMTTEEEHQFILFPEVSYKRLLQVLTETYSRASFKKFHPKRPHDFRHTFVTSIIGRLGGEVSIPFARDIWGHTDQTTIDRYVHLYESMRSRTEKLSLLEDDDLQLAPL